MDGRLFSGPFFTRDGLTWERVGFPVGGLVAANDTIPGMVGRTVGTVTAEEKWQNEFAFPIGTSITGVAFGKNTFLVVTSAGDIVQSERLPVAITIRREDPATLRISTASETLHLEKATTVENGFWEEVGTVAPDSPLLVPIESGATGFFRGRLQDRSEGWIRE